MAVKKLVYTRASLIFPRTNSTIRAMVEHAEGKDPIKLGDRERLVIDGVGMESLPFDFQFHGASSVELTLLAKAGSRPFDVLPEILKKLPETTDIYITLLMRGSEDLGDKATQEAIRTLSLTHEDSENVLIGVADLDMIPRAG